MRYLFSLLLALSLIFTSCNRDNDVQEAPSTITLSVQTIEAEFESQEYSLSVISSDTWVATTQDEWITITTDSGQSGTQELKFVVESNEELCDRQGTILVKHKSGSRSAELSVVQKAFVPAELIISNDYLQFGFDGGRQDVVITANFTYDIAIDCDWVSYERLSTGITVIVEPSIVCDERQAEIRIFNQKYDISQSIVVDQVAFIPRFEIDDISILEFDYTGGTQSISILSNFEYEIISEEDWVIVDQMENCINITVDPIYPVLNKPRSSSIIISDVEYGYGDIEIVVNQRGKESDFKLGEMLEFNGAIGVVFYADAYTTKIVSVEQTKAIWSTEYVVIGASDYDNGMNNMAVIQAVDSWESKYPAVAWCANLGESWYLPAYRELYAIYEVKSTINQTLEKHGYTSLGVDYNYYYWSSTECDNINAFKLYFSTGVWDHHYKYGEYFVRAVYAF